MSSLYFGNDLRQTTHPSGLYLIKKVRMNAYHIIILVTYTIGMKYLA